MSLPLLQEQFDSGKPIRPGHISPYVLHRMCYGDAIEPNTAAVSDIPGLDLHICPVSRSVIPGLFNLNNPLFFDVMRSEADTLHEQRNQAVAAYNQRGTGREVDIQIAGAFALSAANFYTILGKIMLPITTLWWWDAVIPWQQYLQATDTAAVRPGTLAAMMYRVLPHSPDPTTLVVEIHSNMDTCARSVGARQRLRGWYTRRGLPRPLQVPASTMSVRLPSEGFCREFG